MFGHFIAIPVMISLLFVGTSSLSAQDQDDAEPAKAKIESLSESIDPLVEWFKAHDDRVRFIAVLSPT